MRAVLVTFTLLVAMSAVAGTPVVKKASSEANDAARGLLAGAFGSRDALLRADLFGNVVSLGPRLWAATADARRPWASNTKPAYGIVNANLAAQWKIPVPQLTSLPADVQPVLSRMLATRAGVPVVHGGIVGHTKEVATTLLGALISESEFPFTVRPLTESERFYLELL